MTTAPAEPQPLAPSPVAAVRAALGPEALGRLSGIAHLARTTSTNDRLLSLPVDSSHGWVAFADAQTQGRGRRGHGWWSASGAGVYLSLAWRFPQVPAPALGPVSLRLGLAVAEALAPWSAGGLRLKWPNDLLAGEAKLGGLLVETRAAGAGSLVAVGVGVNLRSAPPPEATAGERATCLAALNGGESPAREAIVAALIDALTAALAAWPAAASDDWLARWSQLDALADAPVCWQEAGVQHAGVARGPAEDGSLRVLTAEGERRINAGAVQRLRPGADAPWLQA